MTEHVLAKDDYQRLFDYCLGFAQLMLREHREFSPFGAYIKQVNGELIAAAAASETNSAKEYIDLLYDGYSQGLHEVRACSVCYDALIDVPYTSEKSDAIIVLMEHRSLPPLRVETPYSIGENNDVGLGEVHAKDMAARLFPANGPHGKN